MRSKGPWYADYVARLNFERGVKCQFPNLLAANVRRGYKYRVTVPVPHYEARRICILFRGQVACASCLRQWNPRSHRTATPDGSLCMWYPR